MSVADKFDSVFSVRVSPCMLEKFQSICQAIEVHPNWLLRRWFAVTPYCQTRLHPP